MDRAALCANAIGLIYVPEALLLAFVRWTDHGYSFGRGLPAVDVWTKLVGLFLIGLIMPILAWQMGRNKLWPYLPASVLGIVAVAGEIFFATGLAHRTTEALQTFLGINPIFFAAVFIWMGGGAVAYSYLIYSFLSALPDVREVRRAWRRDHLFTRPTPVGTPSSGSVSAGTPPFTRTPPRPGVRTHPRP